MCAGLAGLMTAWVWTTQWVRIGKDLVTLSEKKVHPQEETPKLDVHSCSPPEHEIGIEEDMFKERDVHGGVKSFVGWRIAFVPFLGWRIP